MSFSCTNQNSLSLTSHTASTTAAAATTSTVAATTTVTTTVATSTPTTTTTTLSSTLASTTYTSLHSNPHRHIRKEETFVVTDWRNITGEERSPSEDLRRRKALTLAKSNARHLLRHRDQQRNVQHHGRSRRHDQLYQEANYTHYKFLSRQLQLQQHQQQQLQQQKNHQHQQQLEQQPTQNQKSRQDENTNEAKAAFENGANVDGSNKSQEKENTNKESLSNAEPGTQIRPVKRLSAKDRRGKDTNTHRQRKRVYIEQLGEGVVNERGENIFFHWQESGGQGSAGGNLRKGCSIGTGRRRGSGGSSGSIKGSGKSRHGPLTRYPTRGPKAIARLYQHKKKKLKHGITFLASTKSAPNQKEESLPKPKESKTRSKTAVGDEDGDVDVDDENILEDGRSHQLVEDSDNYLKAKGKKEAFVIEEFSQAVNDQNRQNQKHDSQRYKNVPQESSFPSHHHHYHQQQQHLHLEKQPVHTREQQQPYESHNKRHPLPNQHPQPKVKVQPQLLPPQDQKQKKHHQQENQQQQHRQQPLLPQPQQQPREQPQVAPICSEFGNPDSDKENTRLVEDVPADSSGHAPSSISSHTTNHAHHLPYHSQGASSNAPPSLLKTSSREVLIPPAAAGAARLPNGSHPGDKVSEKQSPSKPRENSFKTSHMDKTRAVNKAKRLTKTETFNTLIGLSNKDPIEVDSSFKVPLIHSIRPGETKKTSSVSKADEKYRAGDSEGRRTKNDESISPYKQTQQKSLATSTDRDKNKDVSLSSKTLVPSNHKKTQEDKTQILDNSKPNKDPQRNQIRGNDGAALGNGQIEARRADKIQESVIATGSDKSPRRDNNHNPEPVKLLVKTSKQNRSTTETDKASVVVTPHQQEKTSSTDTKSLTVNTDDERKSQTKDDSIKRSQTGTRTIRLGSACGDNSTKTATADNEVRQVYMETNGGGLDRKKETISHNNAISENEIVGTNRQIVESKANEEKHRRKDQENNTAQILNEGIQEIQKQSTSWDYGKEVKRSVSVTTSSVKATSTSGVVTTTTATPGTTDIKLLSTATIPVATAATSLVTTTAQTKNASSTSKTPKANSELAAKPKQSTYAADDPHKGRNNLQNKDNHNIKTSTTTNSNILSTNTNALNSTDAFKKTANIYGFGASQQKGQQERQHMQHQQNKQHHQQDKIRQQYAPRKQQRKEQQGQQHKQQQIKVPQLSQQSSHVKQSLSDRNNSLEPKLGKSGDNSSDLRCHNVFSSVDTESEKVAKRTEEVRVGEESERKKNAPSTRGERLDGGAVWGGESSCTHELRIEANQSGDRGGQQSTVAVVTLANAGEIAGRSKHGRALSSSDAGDGGVVGDTINDSKASAVAIALVVDAKQSVSDGGRSDVDKEKERSGGGDGSLKGCKDDGTACGEGEVRETDHRKAQTAVDPVKQEKTHQAGPSISARSGYRGAGGDNNPCHNHSQGRREAEPMESITRVAGTGTAGLATGNNLFDKEAQLSQEQHDVNVDISLPHRPQLQTEPALKENVQENCASTSVKDKTEQRDVTQKTDRSVDCASSNNTRKAAVVNDASKYRSGDKDSDSETLDTSLENCNREPALSLTLTSDARHSSKHLNRVDTVGGLLSVVSEDSVDYSKVSPQETYISGSHHHADVKTCESDSGDVLRAENGKPRLCNDSPSSKVTDIRAKEMITSVIDVSEKLASPKTNSLEPDGEKGWSVNKKGNPNSLFPSKKIDLLVAQNGHMTRISEESREVSREAKVTPNNHLCGANEETLTKIGADEYSMTPPLKNNIKEPSEKSSPNKLHFDELSLVNSKTNFAENNSHYSHSSPWVGEFLTFEDRFEEMELSDIQDFQFVGSVKLPKKKPNNNTKAVVLQKPVLIRPRTAGLSGFSPMENEDLWSLNTGEDEDDHIQFIDGEQDFFKVFGDNEETAAILQATKIPTIENDAKEVERSSHEASFLFGEGIGHVTKARGVDDLSKTGLAVLNGAGITGIKMNDHTNKNALDFHKSVEKGHGRMKTDTSVQSLVLHDNNDPGGSLDVFTSQDFLVAPPLISKASRGRGVSKVSISVEPAHHDFTNNNNQNANLAEKRPPLQYHKQPSNPKPSQIVSTHHDDGLKQLPPSRGSVPTNGVKAVGLRPGAEGWGHKRKPVAVPVGKGRGPHNKEASFAYQSEVNGSVYVSGSQQRPAVTNVNTTTRLAEPVEKLLAPYLSNEFTTLGVKAGRLTVSTRREDAAGQVPAQPQGPQLQSQPQPQASPPPQPKPISKFNHNHQKPIQSHQEPPPPPPQQQQQPRLPEPHQLQKQRQQQRQRKQQQQKHHSHHQNDLETAFPQHVKAKETVNPSQAYRRRQRPLSPPIPSPPATTANITASRDGFLVGDDFMAAPGSDALFPRVRRRIHSEADINSSEYKVGKTENPLHQRSDYFMAKSNQIQHNANEYFSDDAKYIRRGVNRIREVNTSINVNISKPSGYHTGTATSSNDSSHRNSTFGSLVNNNTNNTELRLRSNDPGVKTTPGSVANSLSNNAHASVLKVPNKYGNRRLGGVAEPLHPKYRAGGEREGWERGESDRRPLPTKQNKQQQGSKFFQPPPLSPPQQPPSPSSSASSLAVTSSKPGAADPKIMMSFNPYTQAADRIISGFSERQQAINGRSTANPAAITHSNNSTTNNNNFNNNNNSNSNNNSSNISSDIISSIKVGSTNATLTGANTPSNAAKLSLAIAPTIKPTGNASLRMAGHKDGADPLAPHKPRKLKPIMHQPGGHRFNQSFASGLR